MKRSPVTVRPFNGTLEDARAIIEIDGKTFKECPYEADEIMAICMDESNFVYVAEIEEAIIGFIAFMKVRTLHYRGLWIDLIAVNPDYQNQGIASHLISVGEDLAEQLKVDFRSALIRTDNQGSISAFEKNDFWRDNQPFNLFFK